MKNYYYIRLLVDNDISDSMDYEIYNDYLYTSYEKALETKSMIADLVAYSSEYIPENRRRYEAIEFDFTSEHSEFMFEWTTFSYYNRICGIEILPLLVIDIDDTLIDLHTKYIKYAN